MHTDSEKSKGIILLHNLNVRTSIVKYRYLCMLNKKSHTVVWARLRCISRALETLKSDLSFCLFHFRSQKVLQRTIETKIGVDRR
jgi:hypothetical protein